MQSYDDAIHRSQGLLARTSRGERANKLAEPARLSLEDDEPTLQTWDGDPYNRRAMG